MQIIRDNNFYNPHERHAIATGAYAVQARNPLYINDGDTPFHNQEAVGHEQDQSSAGAAGISQTIESNASTTDRRRLAATNEQTHQQQRLTPRKRPATSSSSGSQSIRRCLKCRKEKKAKRVIFASSLHTMRLSNYSSSVYLNIARIRMRRPYENHLLGIPWFSYPQVFSLCPFNTLASH